MRGSVARPNAMRTTFHDAHHPNSAAVTHKESTSVLWSKSVGSNSNNSVKGERARTRGQPALRFLCTARVAIAHATDTTMHSATRPVYGGMLCKYRFHTRRKHEYAAVRLFTSDSDAGRCRFDKLWGVGYLGNVSRFPFLGGGGDSLIRREKTRARNAE